jgi:hypothetical protein
VSVAYSANKNLDEASAEDSCNTTFRAYPAIGVMITKQAIR